MIFNSLNVNIIAVLLTYESKKQLIFSIIIKKMTPYQISKSKLLETIDAVLAMDIKQKSFFAIHRTQHHINHIVYHGCWYLSAENKLQGSVRMEKSLTLLSPDRCCIFVQEIPCCINI